jgi:hypothetical protein
MHAIRRDVVTLIGAMCLVGMVIAQNQAEPPTPVPSAPPESGEVFIFNDSGPTLIPGNQNVTGNGKRVASLPRQTYVKLIVPPGPLLLRTDPFLWKQEVHLNVEPGKQYYVVVAYKPERSWVVPIAGSPLLLRQISDAEAMPLLGEMKAQ